MKNGGRIPWSVTAFCETFKIFCLTGKHRMKGDLKNRFKGPILPFGSLVKYHPVSTKDQSRIHKFCKTVLSDIFIGYVLYAEGMWMDRKHYGCGSWGAGKSWTHQKCTRKDSMRKRWQRLKVVKNSYSQSQMEQWSFLGGDQELRTSTLIRDHPIRWHLSWGYGVQRDHHECTVLK